MEIYRQMTPIFFLSAANGHLKTYLKIYYITLKVTPVFDSDLNIISWMYHVGKEEENIAADVKNDSMMSRRKKKKKKM